jgi:hypothetical protein
MKTLLTVFVLLYSFSSFAVWDMLVKAKPNRDYMNFFYKGYLPWYEKTFKKELSFPGNEGKIFFQEAVMKIDHWKVLGHPKRDQFLIGQNEKKEVSLLVYLAPEMRNHSYIKKFKLPFSPEFISWDGKELCFAVFNETPGWRHIPRDGYDYLSHFCQTKGSFTLNYISYASKVETKKFKNPFEGIIEWEIATFDKTKQVKSFYNVKNLHMAFIPKVFYELVMEHGSATHMPLDKFSLNENSEMTVYYP